MIRWEYYLPGCSGTGWEQAEAPTAPLPAAGPGPEDATASTPEEPATRSAGPTRHGLRFPARSRKRPCTDA